MTYHTVLNRLTSFGIAFAKGVGNILKFKEMIKHYLKHAYKFILRDKFHSFLNIFGLAIGITISIITLLFVQNEYNYDGVHEKADRIYLFGVQMTIGDRTDSQRANNRAAGPVLKNNIPGIEAFARIRRGGENLE